MNKVELVAAIAEKSELTKVDAEKALKAFIDTVTEELKNDGKVQLVGFGTFEVVERAARKGRNPKTSEEIMIPASKSPKSSFTISNLSAMSHAKSSKSSK